LFWAFFRKSRLASCHGRVRLRPNRRSPPFSLPNRPRSRARYRYRSLIVAGQNPGEHMGTGHERIGDMNVLGTGQMTSGTLLKPALSNVDRSSGIDLSPMDAVGVFDHGHELPLGGPKFDLSPMDGRNVRGRRSRKTLRRNLIQRSLRPESCSSSSSIFDRRC
jgi:hypothetical protein